MLLIFMFGILQTRKDIVSFSVEGHWFLILYMCILPLSTFSILACRSSDFMVGKVKKYDGFVDYARKALKKLKLHESPLCISNELLEKYYQKYLSRKMELQRLLQVRQLDRVKCCAAFKSYTQAQEY